MRITAALLIVFILVIGGGYVLSHKHTTETTPQMARQLATTTSSTTSGIYTTAEVATHNSSSSCWASISGNVYDLTSWINVHPGGEGPIKSLCGKDGTTAFNAQHGNNNNAKTTLATFKIGTLSE